MKRLLVVMTPLLILALIWGAIGCGEEATPTPTATATTGPTATATATTGPTATPSATLAVTPTPGPSPTATTLPPTATPGGAATATPTRTPASTPTPTGAAKPEGELKLAVGDLRGESFDPLTNRLIQANMYLLLMYDPLVGVNAVDGELSTETGIAQKWEHSADYLSWTFYLRERVKFHNGDEVTAEDVKYTLEKQATTDALSMNAKTVSGNIKEIVVDGPYKMTVNLKARDFFFPYKLSPVPGLEGLIRPKKYIEANGLDYFRDHPVGSGPYRLAGREPGLSFKLEAMDSHFALGVPKYKFITLYGAPEETTRIAMLKGGQADIIEASRQSTAGLRKDGYNIVTSRLDLGVFLLNYNQVGESNALTDPKVREAMRLAIDAQTILDTLLLGQGVLEAQSNYYPYVLGSVDLPPKPYDPERAKQLLKEVGYPERFANPTITIYSMARAGFSEGPAMLEAIAVYWMNVGLKVKIQPVDLTAWAALIIGKKTENAVTYAAYSPNKLAAATLDSQKSSPPVAPYAPLTAPPDLGYDALIDEQAAAKTEEEFVATASKIFRYVYDNSRSPGLFRVKRVYATNQKITQWDQGMIYTDELNLRYLAKQ